MILLVPTSPEVPHVHRPQLWPGLVMVILMCVGYLEILPVLQQDNQFIDNLYAVASRTSKGVSMLVPEAISHLQRRPLLRIAPAPADWDLERILYSNFIHGSFPHLTLNLVGVFAGVRICTSFIPFMCALAIFVLGGSFGIFASLLLSPPGIHGYVPHVGASGGIFALMGAYYVYNFRYRTKYFFWFPSRQGGRIALRTSWFFFVDVILIELVLSMVQLFPNQQDSIDHFAHVFGFGSGLVLALALRFIQRWPAYLQTRSEFLYWSKIAENEIAPFKLWTELLEINPYNDWLKIRLYRYLYNKTESLTDGEIQVAFRFISPTFIRLHTEEVAVFIREVLAKGRTLPREWLARTPYDSVIRIAQFMTSPPEEQYLLYRMVTEYQRAHLGDAEVDRKLALLMRKLSELVPEGVLTAKTSPSSLAETPDIEIEDSTPPPSKSDSPQKKAKKVS